MSRFEDLTFEEIAALRDGERAPVLLLPLGAIEPHGPHAALSTDLVLSTETCVRAARVLREDPGVAISVLPALPYGVTRYAAGFPGAVGIGEEALRAVVLDLCRGLREQGFPRVAIVNNHFEPAQVKTLREAVAILAEEAPGIGLLDLTRRRNAARLTEEFQRGSCHAGRYETSLLLAARPELVDLDRAGALSELEVDMPAAMAAGRASFSAMGMDQAYCGAPAEASAEEGERTYGVLVELLVGLVRELAESA